MKNKDFAHLHNHNEFSYLDGVGKAKDYVAEAKKLGFEYIAITNHGNVDGCIEWQKECDKAEIHPVLGSELYIVPDMSQQNKGEKRGHLTVLVKNLQGWETLCRWLTKANLEGFYKMPRVDYQTILESDVNGLIFLTGCAGSFLRLPGSKQFFYDLVDLAGKDNVYLEIMPHDIEFQREYHVKIKNEGYLDFPLVASNDCHYINKEDCEVQDVLLAIQRNKKWNDPKRWSFGFDGLHLRTADEMVMAFKIQEDFTRKQIISAMENTTVIAERCKDFRIPKQDISLPDIPNVKPGKEDEIFQDRIEDALIALNLSTEQFDQYDKQAKEETDLIIKKGFSKYFLMIQNFVEYCKGENIGVGPGRGSVGGSLVAFLLGITEVDPIKYELSFSRFMTEDRIDWPDIDIDVEKNQRVKAIKYLFDTYGEERVCGISTIMRMKGRAVIRDVGRVFEVFYPDIEKMSNAIFEYEQIEGSSVIYAAEKTPEGKYFDQKYPHELDMAIALEGQIKSVGQHPAGIIVSGDILGDGKRCVLSRRKEKIVANWDMTASEYVGLMKIDVLGLATVSIIKEAVNLVNLERECTDFYYSEETASYFYDKGGTDETFLSELDEVDLDLKYIEDDDEEVFKLLSEGRTSGIFQLSGWASKNLCKDMGVGAFNDIVAIGALARPGPAKSGMTKQYVDRKKTGKVASIHPVYDKITKDTYGLLIYQEQVMQIISQMAGMSETKADKIRKVIGKKRDPKEFEPYKKEFMAGCKKEKTFTPKQASEFWDGLLKWAGYGFNKSHSTAYAMIGYQCAWLKVHYPVEFICANLTFNDYNEKSKDRGDHKQSTINEAIAMGVTVMPPKIGISDPIKWTVKNEILYTPFIEIKSVGQSNADKISKTKVKTGLLGFFDSEDAKRKKKAKKKAQSKLDEILQALGADDPDFIPKEKDILDYLPFVFRDTRIEYEKRKRTRVRPKRQHSKKEAEKNFSPEDDDDIPVLTEQILREGQGWRNTELSGCQKCQLGNFTSGPVLSSIGKYNIAIISEAPGRDEDKGIKTRSGKILRTGLIGEAGNLLWGDLKREGVSRSDVHVTSVCRCFPGENIKISNQNIEACKPYLLKELKRIDCKLILALGNTAVKALTGRTGGITSLSGTTEWNKELQSYIAWCVHPASVLHNPRVNTQYFAKGVKNFGLDFDAMTTVPF